MLGFSLLSLLPEMNICKNSEPNLKRSWTQESTTFEVIPSLWRRSCTQLTPACVWLRLTLSYMLAGSDSSGLGISIGEDTGTGPSKTQVALEDGALASAMPSERASPFDRVSSGVSSQTSRLDRQGPPNNRPGRPEGRLSPLKDLLGRPVGRC